MTLASSYADLLRLGQPIIETKEAATRLGLSVSRTSHILRTLHEADLVRRVRHGLWAVDTDIHPFSLAPYLTAPYPAYMSFWTALAHHGMIEQIPRRIYVASLDRSKRIPTSYGVYSIHHLVAELFDGYTGTHQSGFIATPEKALFDTVYLRASRGGAAHLPELSLPAEFNTDRLDEWIGRIARPRLRTLTSRAIHQALAGATREPEIRNQPSRGRSAP